VPDASDGAALGTSALEFSDLFLADGAVINFGDDQDVSLTHVADTGILLSSTDQLQFGDSGTYIYQSADGVLDLVSDTEIEINATTIDMNGNLDLSGSLTMGSAAISEADIEQIDDLTAGTVTASLGVVVDSNKAIDDITVIKRKFPPSGSSTNGTITGGDIVYFGGTTSMTAGAIYHYKSDGTWELADADAAATSDGLLAVALGAASDTNGMCLRGMVTIDHDPGAIGDVLFLSTTAGDCSATAPSGDGDIVRVIGYQVNHASNGEIWFCPDGTYVEVSA